MTDIGQGEARTDAWESQTEPYMNQAVYSSGLVEALVGSPKLWQNILPHLTSVVSSHADAFGFIRPVFEIAVLENLSINTKKVDRI